MSGWSLVAAVLLLGGNAFFVGAEFSVISVRRSQIEPLAEGSRRAQTVLEALRNLSLMLAASQLGITLCSLGLGAVAEPAVAALFESLFELAHVPEQLLHPVSFAVALSLVVFLHMVLGEMVPKNIAIASPERAALVLVPPLALFARGVRPVLTALNAFGNGFLRMLRVEPKDELASSFSPDELAAILAQSREEGLLDEQEHDRLSGALELGSQPASTVMLPLDRLVTVSDTVTADELEELVVITGFSRFPMRSAQDDAATLEVEGGMLGFVHVKDVLGLSERERREPLRLRRLRPMPRLGADLPLSDVLTLLQRSQSHLGQVVDAEGRAVGVIALEDVVEQFVGEVEDETNPLNAPALTEG